MDDIVMPSFPANSEDFAFIRVEFHVCHVGQAAGEIRGVAAGANPNVLEFSNSS